MVKYLFCGSVLTDDYNVLRIFLEGLNTWGRVWRENVVVLDDGSLPGLEGEVAEFRHLEHRHVDGWADRHPNIVIAFMDRLSHNRETEQLLRRAESAGIPAYVIGRYGVGT